MNRYRITVDKASFLDFYWGSDRAGITLETIPTPPESEDAIVVQVFRHDNDNEDITVQILTEYSTWVSTQE